MIAWLILIGLSENVPQCLLPFIKIPVEYRPALLGG
jgi:hypothetical protein